MCIFDDNFESNIVPPKIFLHNEKNIDNYSFRIFAFSS